MAPRLPLLDEEEDENDGTQDSQDEENEGLGDGEEGEEDAEDGQDGGDEDEEAGEAEEDERVLESRIPRRQRAVQSLRKRAQAAERERDEIKRRLDELERSGNNSRNQRSEEENEVDEATKLALMTDSEKIDYKLNKGLDSIKKVLAQSQVSNFDRQDRSNYDKLMRTDKLARRFENEVENLYADLMKQGKPTPRDTILNFIIGQKSRAASSSGKTRQQRRDAERRVAKERINTNSGRSDVSSERRRGGKTLEQRLEGIKI